MITIDINAVWVMLLAVGVPSGIVSFVIRRLEKKMDTAEKQRKEQDQERIELQKMLINATMDSLDLAKATAEAVQRIPDAHCNGEMRGALDKATATLTTFRSYEREQTAKIAANVG